MRRRNKEGKDLFWLVKQCLIHWTLSPWSLTGGKKNTNNANQPTHKLITWHNKKILKLSWTFKVTVHNWAPALKYFILQQNSCEIINFGQVIQLNRGRLCVMWCYGFKSSSVQFKSSHCHTDIPNDLPWATAWKHQKAIQWKNWVESLVAL